MRKEFDLNLIDNVRQMLDRFGQFSKHFVAFKDPGGYLRKIWVGVHVHVRRMYDFPYPISDLIQNTIPYIRPAHMPN